MALCLQVRVIFRLIEFGPGLNSYNAMLTNELFPFMLDALPMLLAFVALNIMHPGYILKGPDGEFPKLTRAEKKAIKEKKKQEKAERKAAKKGGAMGKYMRTEDIALDERSRGTTDSESERPFRHSQRVDWSRANNV